jgi:hypothetical protein
MHTITLLSLIGVAAGIATLLIIFIDYRFRARQFSDEIIRPKDHTIDSAMLIRIRSVNESKNGWTGFLGE